MLAFAVLQEKFVSPWSSCESLSSDDWLICFVLSAIAAAEECCSVNVTVSFSLMCPVTRLCVNRTLPVAVSSLGVMRLKSMPDFFDALLAAFTIPRGSLAEVPVISITSPLRLIPVPASALVSVSAVVPASSPVSVSAAINWETTTLPFNVIFLFRHLTHHQ